MIVLAVVVTVGMTGVTAEGGDVAVQRGALPRHFLSPVCCGAFLLALSRVVSAHHLHPDLQASQPQFDSQVHTHTFACVHICMTLRCTRVQHHT